MTNYFSFCNHSHVRILLIVLFDTCHVVCVTVILRLFFFLFFSFSFLFLLLLLFLPHVRTRSLLYKNDEYKLCMCGAKWISLTLGENAAWLLLTLGVIALWILLTLEISPL